MKALHLKLIRDLLKMKGQVIAIALVLAAGISMFVLMISTYDSLRISRDAYYRQNRFADVFAGLKSAPRHVVEKIVEIPGVSQAHTRIVRDVTLDIPNLEEVATARLISLRMPKRPALNDPYLREGRFPESGEEGEILLSEPFALAHGYRPGDRVAAIINGKRRMLDIVGIAISPEYIFAIKPGDVFPDNRRFGIIWMAEKALEAAFNMEGGFNDLSLKLAREASVPTVLDAVDGILEPYGGLDAISRKDQISHWFLENEFTQLKVMGRLIPLLFFSVAVFLLNIVLARLIRGQREQIGILKAFGYGFWSMGAHFLSYVAVIVVTGTVAGVAVGAWLGSEMTQMYTEFFSFPVLRYTLDPTIIIGAFLFSLGAGTLGSMMTVKRAAGLAPAEAMRPEPPSTFRPTLAERFGFGRYLSAQLRMILRHLERQPFRSGFSVLGIGLATGLMVFGRYNIDAVFYLIDINFNIAQRQDVNVTFYEPKAYRAFHELSGLRGVSYAEPLRTVPVRLRNGHVTRRTGILGIAGEPTLQRPLTEDLQLIEIPREGLAIGRKLSEVLGVGVGDSLRVEVMEGERPHLVARVSALVDEYIGSNVYMNMGALNRLMGENRVINGAYLRVEGSQAPLLFKRLKNSPAVAGVTAKEASITSFKKTVAENLLIMNLFNIIFSGIIAVGVVYNSAQMTLNERRRDLATLRVLGFTRGEISGILLGELAVLTLIAIPLGFLIGYGLSFSLAKGYETELFRMPMVLYPRTYGIAAITIMASALFSGLIVRRKLDRLDLLAVLKTRE